MMEAPSARQSGNLQRGAKHRSFALPSVVDQLKSKIESLIGFASLGIADLESMIAADPAGWRRVARPGLSSG
jgi:hypothetical protein